MTTLHSKRRFLLFPTLAALWSVGLLCAPLLQAQPVSQAPIALSGDDAPGTDLDFFRFFNPSIDNNGRVGARIRIGNDSDFSNETLYTYQGGTWQLFQRGGTASNPGDTPPGGGSDNYRSFDSEFVMDDSGLAAYRAIYWNPNQGNAFAQGTGPSDVAWIAGYNEDVASKEVPGLPEPGWFRRNTSADFQQPTYNNGILALRAKTIDSDGVDIPLGRGIWVGTVSSDPTDLHASLQVLAIDGMAAPGSTQNFANPDTRIAINSSGEAIFFSFLDGGGNHRGFWGGTPGNVVAVAAPGQAAPETGEPDNVFSTTSNVAGSNSINSHGTMVFQQVITGTNTPSSSNSVLYTRLDGDLRLLARQNDQVPGSGSDDVRFDIFGKTSLNDNNIFAFRSTLKGSDVTEGVDDQAIFRGPLHGLQMLARRGEQAPGLASGILFDNLSLTLALNTLDDVVFLADLTDGVDIVGSGIFAFTNQDGLFNVAHTGQVMEVAPGDFRTIADLDLWLGTGGADGQVRSLNDNGELVYRVEFTDGSSAIYLAAIPEPSTALLLAFGLAPLFCRRRSQNRSFSRE